MDPALYRLGSSAILETISNCLNRGLHGFRRFRRLKEWGLCGCPRKLQPLHLTQREGKRKRALERLVGALSRHENPA